MEKVKIAIRSTDDASLLRSEKMEIERLSALFGVSEGERLRSITNRKSRFSSMCGLSALSSVIENKEQRIYRGANSKPYFEDERCGCFSISHSDRLSVAAYALSEIGIDIEKIDTKRNVEKIASRFFTDRESDYLKGNGYAPKAFYKLWTEKESYVKYLGESFSSTYSKDACGVSFQSFLIEYRKDLYFMSVCTQKKLEIEINLLSEGIIVNQGE